ncbi:MAG: class I SAM-dependent methyltransferase [Acidobacteria bacterium]|nr:class I SAM-dependent methyltransferase [Acidobacteriota bacterium]
MDRPPRERDADSWDDPAGAEAYAEAVREGSLYRALAARLVEALAPSGGGLWLDLATGSGIVAERLSARLGPVAAIVGADRSRAMLEVARRALPLVEAAFVRADPAALPLAAGSVRGAACSAALWHFPALGAVFAELARVLEPGARFAFNAPAAQLAGDDDLPPAPLQLALAREGLARFGTPPAPGGPVRARAEILRAAREAGLAAAGDGWIEVTATQRELADLLAVPAIAGRMYPAAPPAARAAWIRAAAAAVALDEPIHVRWWQTVLQNRGQLP